MLEQFSWQPAAVR
jgi:hypothetical protein